MPPKLPRGMAIIYSLVSQGTVPLCEHTHEGHEGNFCEIAKKIISRITQQEGDCKMTYVFDKHTFNFRIVSHFVFMCMADEEFGRNMPFVYLKELSDEFFRMFGKDGRSHSYSSFNRVMEEKMKQFSTSDDNNHIVKIQKGLDEVKDVMKSNITKVLERGEQIDVLVDKSENLTLTSDSFRVQSRTLRKNLCWTNVKMKLLALVLVLILVYLLAASTCGITLKQC